jgi:drug/metabolite transporter (DMT)-like permease
MPFIGLTDYFILTCIGFAYAMLLIFKVKALQNQSATKLSIMFYLKVVILLFFDVLFFGASFAGS